MVTVMDSCVVRHVWQDDYGLLGGSSKYDFSDRIFTAVKVRNILIEETVLEQQVQNAG